MPQIIIEIKKTNLAKKILLSQRNNTIGHLIPLLVFVPFYILNVSIMFILITIVNYDSLDIFKYVDWGTLLFGAFFAMLIGISIGKFIYTYIASFQVAALVSGVLIILFGFLSGAFIPLTSISQIKALNGVTYINPFRYPLTIIIHGFNSSSSPTNINHVSFWDLNKDYVSLSLVPDTSGDTFKFIPNELTVFTSIDKILALALSPLLSIIFLGIGFEKQPFFG